MTDKEVCAKNLSIDEGRSKLRNISLVQIDI